MHTLYITSHFFATGYLLIVWVTDWNCNSAYLGR